VILQEATYDSSVEGFGVVHLVLNGAMLLPDVVSIQDLVRLAWRRVKADLAHRVFVRHPCEVELVELELNSWLERLAEDYEHQRYSPRPATVCEVPKPGGATRPSVHLSLEDRTIYTAAVSQCFPQLVAALKWADGNVDFSYPIETNVNRWNWLKSPFHRWAEFRTRSLELIDTGVSYVVTADICGYYEHVDLSLLYSDLRALDVDHRSLQLLSTCLNKWAQIPGRGLPQGHSASDILGKLYLNSVDLALQNERIRHMRYVDDIRIFCNNKTEARRALVTLVRLLRRRGLSIQSAKSKILRADEARTSIDGLTPVVQTIQRKYFEVAKEWYAIDDPYTPFVEVERRIVDDPESPPLPILHEIFATYFTESDRSQFEKTLFRFVVKRLGRLRDRTAVNYCLGLLEDRPEETSAVLQYLQAVRAVDELADQVMLTVTAPAAVYPYQRYQALTWLMNHASIVSSLTLVAIRSIAFTREEPSYVRAIAITLLGVYGNAADLERLESEYPMVSTAMERAEIICALSRVERSRRNGFYARARVDGEVENRAVTYATRQADERSQSRTLVDGVVAAT
jgi:hypothetical protein